MEKIFFIVLSVVFVLSLLLLVNNCGTNPTGGGSTPSWHIVTVDDVGYPPCRVVLDSLGNPHMVYLGYSTSSTLAYASYNSSSWFRSAVTSESSAFDIAVDGKKVPHICFRAGNHLCHATLEGTAWITDTVEQNVYPTHISLAIGTSGKIHVIYYKSDTKVLRYATKEAGSPWVKTTASNGTAEYTSMALDGSGNPNVSYSDGNNIKFTHWNGSSWVAPEVVSAEAGEYTSIALDGSGNPSISYYGTTNSDLRYASLEGASWDTETVDSSGITGISSSLTIDSNNNPHICYAKDGLYIKHSWQDQTTWETGTLDFGEYVSSARSGSVRPKTAYIRNGALKYAEYY